jgi:hypothetical protein
MKKKSSKQSKVTPPQGKFINQTYGGKGDMSHIVSDKQQEDGEASYDNEGQFGIGMSKSK